VAYSQSEMEEIVRAAVERSADARERLRSTLREMHDKGMPVAVMARVAGVSRQTIYTWLEG
jgi:hypothetical protein